jgi:hypothetical protein
MTIKNTIFVILVALITVDIILTNFFVIFYDAIEINPVCISFTAFMWIIFIIILISIYSGLLYFNLNNIINYFF